MLNDIRVDMEIDVDTIMCANIYRKSRSGDSWDYRSRESRNKHFLHEKIKRDLKEE
jgi:hypothetical protein